MKNLKKDPKFKVSHFGDASQVRMTNRRLTVVEVGGKIFIDTFYAAEDPDTPAVKHECIRGKIRHTTICFSEEAMDAICISWMSREGRIRALNSMPPEEKKKLQYYAQTNRIKTMNKFELLETMYMSARKEKNDVVKNLLSTFKGEVELELKSESNVGATEEMKLEVLHSKAKSMEKNLLTLKSHTADPEQLEKIDLELSIISRLLPVMMSKEEIEIFIVSQDLSTLSNNGAIMGRIMKELKGKADGNDVKEVVGKLFS